VTLIDFVESLLNVDGGVILEPAQVLGGLLTLG
jgi:hypothetical protein